MSVKEIKEHLDNNEILSSIEKLHILSKKMNIESIEYWTSLELSGYFSKMKDEDKVPEYRIVGGQYKDQHGRPLHIAQAKLAFLNEYRLRHPLPQLIKMSREGNKSLIVKDPELLENLNKELDLSLVCYSFSASCLEIVFSAIRTKAREAISEIEMILQESELDFSSSDFFKNLHPDIIKVSGKLYQNGHYRQALLDANIFLVSKVKNLSGLKKDGVPLAQTAFSRDKPILKVSECPDERLGFMWLFSGAIMGIRNPNAHQLKDVTCPQETLEWLGFASALLRRIENAEKVS